VFFGFGFGLLMAVSTIAYTVFYHDLLISKLHYIDYKNNIDGIHHAKYMLHSFQKI